MTTNPHAKWEPRPTATPPPPAKPKRSKPIFLIIFLLFQALFAIWLVSGLTAVSAGPEDCTYLTDAECNDAHAAGAAIGIGFVLAIWAAFDIIVGGTYAIYRLVRRPR